MKFIYTVDPAADEPIILVNKWIGMDDVEGPGIMGDQFQAELLALDAAGKKRIQVWINSPGGVVVDGYSMYNAILKSKTKVDTYCVGIAASIAGVLFQAGRKRIMADYGMLMYHNPYAPDGKVDDQLEMMRKSIITMIARTGGKSEADIEEMMNRTTWIGAADALGSGMCDEIEYSKDQNKKRAVPSEDVKAFWKEKNLVLNNILNHEKPFQSMKAVANIFGLKPDADEAEIALKAQEMKNELVAANATIKNSKKNDDDADDKKDSDEVNSLKAKLKAAEDELNQMKAKFPQKNQADADAIKNSATEIEALKAKLKVAEEALAAIAVKNKEARKVKAKADVEAFVKAGKIADKPEIKAKWETMFEADETDTILGSVAELPVNKVANKIETSKLNEVEEKKLTGVVANVMHEIRNKLKI